MPEKVFIRGIPDNLWRALKAKASLDGLTVSRAIQRAIRLYLQGGRYPAEAPARSRVSERRSDYLASPDAARKRHQRPAAPVLATFTGRIPSARNRCLEIPVEVQQTLGLRRKEDNDLLLVSIRQNGKRNWSRLYLKLTDTNQLTVPANAIGVAPRQDLVVRVHRVIADRALEPPPEERTAADVLFELMSEADPNDPGWREDGSIRLDDYLNEDIHGD